MTGGPRAALGEEAGPRALLALYVALVIYGSLYPFSGWRWPDDLSQALLRGGWDGRLSKSDVVTNLLVYLPVGYLGVRVRSGAQSPLGRVLPACLLGAALSLTLESLQVFLASRQSSVSDLLLNGVSTAAGALAAGFGWQGTRIGERLARLRQDWFLAGRRSELSLWVLAFWSLSQLAPFVPSLDLGNLRHGLSPLWQTLRGAEAFRPAEAAVYFLDLAGLIGVALLAATRRRRAGLAFLAVAGAVLLLKVPVVGRQLSLEAVAGFGAALLALPLALRLPGRWLAGGAGLALAAAFVIDELRPVTGAAQAACLPFNWVPFSGQIANLMGVASVLEGTWPFAAMSVLCRELPSGPRRTTAFAGGALLVLAVATLEWEQQQIPGRYPDITAVILAISGWSLPWILASLGPGPGGAEVLPTRDGHRGRTGPTATEQTEEMP